MNERDPQGKRALFSDAPIPPAAGSGVPIPPGPGRSPGKEALYSTAVRRPGTVVLECSSCHGRTRVDVLELALRHLPVWLWIPGRRYSRLLRCPACERRTWVRVSWLA
ncbi:MAG: hypothetical protein M5U14_16040 [Acidimicrobiia bacterium]|nr:hypothetical protein [Acidimicrobiia bacterium]